MSPIHPTRARPTGMNAPRNPRRRLACAWLLVAPCADVRALNVLENPMDPHLPVYSWLRGGGSLHVARVVRVVVQPAASGQERTTVELAVQQTLWGAELGPVAEFAFDQPASAISQAKFPHPTWGGIQLKTRPYVLLAMRDRNSSQAEPLAVCEVTAGDPALAAIVEITRAEASTPAPGRRAQRYIEWLQPGRHAILQLFAAQALGVDPDLAGVDPDGRVASEFVRLVRTSPDVYVRIAVATWMWDGLWTRTNGAGRVAIADSAVAGLLDANPDVVRFSFDRLLGLDTLDPIQHRNAAAAAALRTRESPDASAVERERLQALVWRLTP